MSSIREIALGIVRGMCLTFEGVFLKPYLCPANVPTIGIGSTAYEDGRKVTLADAPISRERAVSLCDATLTSTYMPAVEKLCAPARSNANTLAALTDFAYNLGCTRLAGSTLLRKVNAGDMTGAKAELMKWTRGGGRVLPGLVKRRKAEAALISL